MSYFRTFPLLCITILFSESFRSLSAEPVLTTHYLIDLYRLTTYPLTELTTFWKYNGLLDQQPRSTTCMGAGIGGGPGEWIAGDEVERVYDGIGTHETVFYMMSFYVMDTWLVGDTITIKIDDRAAFSFQPKELIDLQGSSICGAPTLDADFILKGIVNHSRSSLKLTISSYSSNPSTTDASFGVFDFKMRFTKSESNQIENSCIATNSFSNLAFACGCARGTYWNTQTLNCENCNSACHECFGPSIYDCYTCPFYWSYDVELDKCVPCTSNCFLCSGAQVDKCHMCQNVPLYWNHTCGASCTLPYQYNSGYCTTPCQPNKFMLLDGSCTETCLSPFVERIEGDAKFCDSPCDRALGEFLYWDGSCKPTCPYYQHFPYGEKLCDSCQPHLFSYPNSSCLEKCPAPYKLQTRGQSKFCMSPCGDTLKFYDNKTSECKAQCNYPYQVIDEIFCVLRISDKYAELFNAVSLPLATQKSGGRYAGASVSLLKINNPAPIFCQLFGSILTSLKYLNITYPANLEYMLTMKLEFPFTLIPGLPEELTNQILRRPLPGKFEEDEDLHSSFFINFWTSFATLFALTVTAFLAKLLEFCTKKWETISSFFTKIKNALVWNFLISNFISYFGDIILFTSIEVTTATLASAFEILSFISCFSFTFIMAITFSKTISVIRTRWRRLLHKEKSDHKEDNLEKYKVIFNGLKEISLFHQSFMLIFLGRICMLMIIISYFYNYPMFQITIILLLSIIMLLYLLILRPVKDIVDLVQYILQEITLLIAKGCIFGMSILDQAKTEKLETREALGNIVVGCSLTLSSISTLYLFLKLILFLKEAYSFWKLRPNKTRNVEHQIEDSCSKNICDESSEIKNSVINVRNIEEKQAERVLAVEKSYVVNKRFRKNFMTQYHRKEKIHEQSAINNNQNDDRFSFKDKHREEQQNE